MAHALPLYRMVPSKSFEGTVLVDEALAPSEVAQRIKEVMELPKGHHQLHPRTHVSGARASLNAAGTRVFGICKFFLPRASLVV